jgi:hypothetical protein
MYYCRLQINWVFLTKKKLQRVADGRPLSLPGPPSHHFLNVLAFIQIANKNGVTKNYLIYSLTNLSYTFF